MVTRIRLTEPRKVGKSGIKSRVIGSVKADDWYDDEDWGMGGGMTNITVYEPECEPDALMSPILGPDGEPIIYEYESPRMPFIGFVELKEHDDAESE